MKNKNKENNKSGFTLLEALVAVSILMVAVMAPITIAQKVYHRQLTLKIK